MISLGAADALFLFPIDQRVECVCTVYARGQHSEFALGYESTVCLGKKDTTNNICCLLSADISR